MILAPPLRGAYRWETESRLKKSASFQKPKQKPLTPGSSSSMARDNLKSAGYTIFTNGWPPNCRGPPSARLATVTSLCPRCICERRLRSGKRADMSLAFGSPRSFAARVGASKAGRRGFWHGQAAGRPERPLPLATNLNASHHKP